MTNTNHKQNEEQKQDPISLSEVSSRSLLFLSLGSAAVYLLLSLLIFYFYHEQGILDVFKAGYSGISQLAIGTAAGILASLIIKWAASRKPVAGVLRDFYIVREIADTRFTTLDRIQLSLFAGVGEELLFRGAVQPLLGIWVTSILFVAIHGYFKFRKPGHWLFGILMFGLSMLLGLLFQHVGLIAAMCAHAVYDVLMLRWVQSGLPAKD